MLRIKTFIVKYLDLGKKFQKLYLTVEYTCQK